MLISKTKPNEENGKILISLDRATNVLTLSETLNREKFANTRTPNYIRVPSYTRINLGF